MGLSEKKTASALTLVYHLLPRNLEGEIIYPLNAQKDILPKAYERNVEKYRSRQELLERRIPALGCLWNDVVHFSPVHPAVILQALTQAAHEWPAEPTRWIEAEPRQLGMSSDNSTLYFPRPRERGDFNIVESDFSPFSDEATALLGDLPPETVEYYRRCRQSGERPFLFHLIPHVLYRGLVRLDEVEVISV